MSFAVKIQEDRGQPATVRIGTVSDDDPFTVTVQGVPYQDVGILGGCPPVGATVVLLGQSAVSAKSSSWLLLGALGSACANTVSSGVDGTAVATTSGAFVPLTGGFNVGVVFTAPTSGRVLIHFRTSQFAPGGSTAIASIRLGLDGVIGAGTLVQAASDNEAISGSSAEFGTTIDFLNLTPGAVYNAEMQHRSSGGGNCFWARREIIVAPAQ